MLHWGWGSWEAHVGPELGLWALGLGSPGPSEQDGGDMQSMAVLEH